MSALTGSARCNRKRAKNVRSGLHDYLPDFLATFFCAFFTALTARFEGPFVPLLASASNGMSLLVMGVPSPVQASHPEPALNAPLLPLVMSLNAEAALPKKASS